MERELIHFSYQKIWQQEWKGHDVPKEVYRSFLNHVGKISDRFTMSRSELRSDYLDAKEGRYAYLLYFHLANVCRNLAVMREIHRNRLFPANVRRVLDVGTGMGSALWGLFLSHDRWDKELEVTAADRSRKSLVDMKDLLDLFARGRRMRPLDVKLKAMDLFDERTPKQVGELPAQDLIFCSNVLNEVAKVSKNRAVSLVHKFIDRLSDDGLLIVVEPALNQTSRELTLLRDEILKKGDVYVPAPCGHEGPCPLNNEPRDWCHFETAWDPPALRRRFEKSLRHASGVLKYSYLVFSRRPVGDATGKHRVLSDRLSERDGHFSWLLCSPEKKLKMVLDKKYYKEEPYRNLGRGDRVKLELHPITRRKDISPYSDDVQSGDPMAIEID